MGVVAVTARACRLGMPADKRIISQLVIEAVAIESRQLSTAAMMFAVADFAGLAPRIRLAVKTCATLNI